jgi:hypothetical protein
MIYVIIPEAEYSHPEEDGAHKKSADSNVSGYLVFNNHDCPAPN